MALKRKLDSHSGDNERSTKQLKLVPFPTYEPDNDVCMSDASSDQDLLTVDPHHGRFNSTSSAVSSDAESPLYPPFTAAPGQFFAPNGRVNTDSHNFSRYSPPPQRPVGIFEPRRSFSHNGSCTQIPKLRVACSSGVQVQRSMWSHCEQCGAIEMIDPDY